VVNCSGAAFSTARAAPMALTAKDRLLINTLQTVIKYWIVDRVIVEVSDETVEMAYTVWSCAKY